MTYGSDETPEQALINAKKLIAAGADSVKLEGPNLKSLSAWSRRYFVVGHSGLTPQTATNFKQVGKGENEAKKL